MTQEITFNTDKTALVVIDLQKGIVGLPTTRPSSQVVSQAAKLIAQCRSRGILVVKVKVDFASDGADAPKPITDSPQASHQRPADFAEFVPELHQDGQGLNGKKDIVIVKHNWGAFHGTELDLQLRRRGIDTIIMCGISTNIGVDTTAREAFQLGYQQVFVEDAMTALSKEEHEFPIKYTFPRLGRIRSTEEVIAYLK